MKVIKKVAFTAGRASRESTSTYGKINAYEQVFGSVGDNRFLSECYTLEDGLKAGEHFLQRGKTGLMRFMRMVTRLRQGLCIT